MKRRVAEGRKKGLEAKVAQSMSTPRSASAHSAAKIFDPLPGSARGPTTILDERARRETDELNSYPSRHNQHGGEEGGLLSPLVSDDRHPRILLVSSDCHARVLLLNAVRFDVASLPYDAGGTSAEALLRRVALLLRGRKVILLFSQDSARSLCVHVLHWLSDDSSPDPDSPSTHIASSRQHPQRSLCVHPANQIRRRGALGLCARENPANLQWQRTCGRPSAGSSRLKGRTTTISCRPCLPSSSGASSAGTS